MIELGILIAITSGLVEVIKRLKIIDESRYLPLFALVIGVIVVIFSGIENLEPVITGIIVGLSAIGLYSGQKAVRGK